MGEGLGDTLGEGDGAGDTLGDGLGTGGSVGVGDGIGDGSSALSVEIGAMRLNCFGAGALPDGDGAGVGDALGDGDDATFTQNVPSADQNPARPFLSTPGTSSDIGGAVRVGAGTVLCAGLAVGAVVGAGAVPLPLITGLGAFQSSGCTTVSPVVPSYWMIRTPDSRAHASRLS